MRPLNRKIASAYFAPLLSIALIANTPQEQSFCERQMERFDNNEREMAIIHDLYSNLRTAEQEFYEGTGDPRSAQKIIEYGRKISDNWREGVQRADAILALMIAADCELPDHDASPLTYSELGG